MILVLMLLLVTARRTGRGHHHSLSLLFAIVVMNLSGVSGNLMSLGAIDFGLLVDGAVIIVENAVRRLSEQRTRLGALSSEQRIDVVREATLEVRAASLFGEAIIAIVYLPLLALTESRQVFGPCHDGAFALLGPSFSRSLGSRVTSYFGCRSCAPTPGGAGPTRSTALSRAMRTASRPCGACRPPVDVVLFAGSGRVNPRSTRATCERGSAPDGVALSGRGEELASKGSEEPRGAERGESGGAPSSPTTLGSSSQT